MNELELKSLWQIANIKLEKAFTINKINSYEISQLKVVHLISSMKPIKIFALLIGVIWVGLGTLILTHLFLNAYSEANKFFLFSASIQVGLTAIALLIYLYQLITIFKVDITEPILKAQERLASLKVSTLWITRILFLQLPVWTTFWWNETMLTQWYVWQWIMTVILTLSFSFIAFWLFFNIKYENRNKRWFKLIFSGNQWIPLMKSIELLEQVEEYKPENLNK